jgi:hypothetical protein
MENLEYRTMRFDAGGAHEGHMSGILDGCNGAGHPMSNANSGGGHSMSKGGTWLASVKSKVTRLGRKEPTH